jgi:UDP-N-acetylmuramoyl-tripeptide--D-alanyl-D-alanine ligase
MEKLYQLYKQSTGICTDTRKIEPSCLFFALKGVNFDGNKFAKEALDKGALAVVIDDEKQYIDNKTILVDDTLKTLQKLALYHRKQLDIPILAITGSNGKTTTKELINAVLSKKYKTAATIDNLNNHIGVPLTLLSFTPKHNFGIVEMGANHVGEIALLCEIAEPDFGLITNIGTAHIEGFGSKEGIIKGKTELYNFLKLNNGTVFVNYKDAILKEKTEGIKTIFYNQDEAELYNSFPNIEFKWKSKKGFSKLYGAYNFTNILAAITIGEYFKVASNDILNAIADYTPTNNRSQIETIGTNTVLIDAYNANPTSMQAALDTFKAIDKENKIVILGDMLELGNSSLEEHKNILKQLDKAHFNKVYLIGDEFKKASKNEAYVNFKNIEAFNQYLSENPIRDAYVLLKGSRGIRLEKCLEYLK